MLMIHCVKCNKATEMMSVKEVSAFIRRSPRTIYRWIKQKRLHFNRDAGGGLFICRRSVLTPGDN
jgi:excisionase family DNA binding protein